MRLDLLNRCALICVSNGFTTTGPSGTYFANNSAILAGLSTYDPSGGFWQYNNFTSVTFPVGTNCMAYFFVCKGVKVPWSNGDLTNTSDYDCEPSFAGATLMTSYVVGTVASPTLGLAACTAKLANYSASYTFMNGATCNTNLCNTAALLTPPPPSPPPPKPPPTSSAASFCKPLSIMFVLAATTLAAAF